MRVWRRPTVAWAPMALATAAVAVLGGCGDAGGAKASHGSASPTSEAAAAPTTSHEPLPADCATSDYDSSGGAPGRPECLDEVLTLDLRHYPVLATTTTRRALALPFLTATGDLEASGVASPSDWVTMMSQSQGAALARTITGTDLTYADVFSPGDFAADLHGQELTVSTGSAQVLDENDSSVVTRTGSRLVFDMSRQITDPSEGLAAHGLVVVRMPCAVEASNGTVDGTTSSWTFTGTETTVTWHAECTLAT